MPLKKLRLVEKRLKSHFDRFSDKVLILVGPRQVGKTTLVKRIFNGFKYWSCDNNDVADILNTYSVQVYKRFLGNTKQIILDEVHFLKNPGLALKLLHDNFDIKIVVTGSSSLQIKLRALEYLTGRFVMYKMFPLTIGEALYQTGETPELQSVFVDYLIHSKLLPLGTKKLVQHHVFSVGLYPDTLNYSLLEVREFLTNLVESTLEKDLGAAEIDVSWPKIVRLLKVLAVHVGGKIEVSKLASDVGLHVVTVERYLEILEKAFIIFRLPPYYTNKKKEIIKAHKLYFWDVGFRNALLGQFSEFSSKELGALWENIVISELYKEILTLNLTGFNLYYWQSKQGYEVDLVIKTPDLLKGVEVKLASGNITRAFMNRYKEAQTQVVRLEELL